MNEKEKMLNGFLYDGNYDKSLFDERIKCKTLCHKFNMLSPDKIDERPRLRSRLQISPFFCRQFRRARIHARKLQKHYILDGRRKSVGSENERTNEATLEQTKINFPNPQKDAKFNDYR